MENEYLKIENAVLGAIILENYAYDLVCEDLKPHCFQFEKNQIIYRAIAELKIDGSAVDYMTIAQKIKDKGLYDSKTWAYILDLTHNVASAGNIESHAKIVLQRYLLRKIKEICSFGLIKVNDRDIDVFDVYDEIKGRFETTINEVTANKSFDTIDSMATEFLEYTELKRMGIIPPALTTGLYEIDKYGGYNNSDLIIIGARPGMGKTAYVMLTMRHIAFDLKKSVGVFSIEMKSQQLLTRIASAECKISGENLRKGNITNEEVNRLNQRLNELRASKIYIDDKTKSIDSIIQKAHRMKRKHGIDILIIDYLGLITAKGHGNKNAEVSDITAKLKGLAKDLDIPVICLSQLNRDVDSLPLDKRLPILSHLRDSGSIEQDADQIIFIFRPDYYNVDTFFIGGSELDTRGKALIIYAKNRHGVTETKLVGFRGEFTEFHNLPGQYPETEVVSDKVANQPNNNFLNETNTGEDLPF